MRFLIPSYFRVIPIGVAFLLGSLLAGCQQQAQNLTQTDQAALAPGINDMSPDAKAAMQRNADTIRVKQAQMAQQPKR